MAALLLQYRVMNASRAATFFAVWAALMMLAPFAVFGQTTSGSASASGGTDKNSGLANKQCPAPDQTHKYDASKGKEWYEDRSVGPYKFYQRIENLYGKKCQDVRNDVEVVEGICVAEDKCKATECYGTDCKLPDQKVDQEKDVWGDPKRPDSGTGQTDTNKTPTNESDRIGCAFDGTCETRPIEHLPNSSGDAVNKYFADQLKTFADGSKAFEALGGFSSGESPLSQLFGEYSNPNLGTPANVSFSDPTGAAQGLDSLGPQNGFSSQGVTGFDANGNGTVGSFDSSADPGGSIWDNAKEFGATTIGEIRDFFSPEPSAYNYLGPSDWDKITFYDPEPLAASSGFDTASLSPSGLGGGASDQAPSQAPSGSFDAAGFEASFTGGTSFDSSVLPVADTEQPVSSFDEAGFTQGLTVPGGPNTPESIVLPEFAADANTPLPVHVDQGVLFDKNSVRVNLVLDDAQLSRFDPDTRALLESARNTDGGVTVAMTREGRDALVEALRTGAPLPDTAMYPVYTPPFIAREVGEGASIQNIVDSFHLSQTGWAQGPVTSVEQFNFLKGDWATLDPATGLPTRQLAALDTGVVSDAYTFAPQVDTFRSGVPETADQILQNAGENNQPLGAGGSALTDVKVGDQTFRVTGYFPCDSGSCTVQGGLQSSRPGPDGESLVRTLDDYRLGKSDYVTGASDPSRYGEKYVVPEITYRSPIDGQTYTLSEVPVAIHDTGGAFQGRPDKLDVAVGNAQSDSQAIRLASNQPFLAQSSQTYDKVSEFPTSFSGSTGRTSAEPIQTLGSDAAFPVAGDTRQTLAFGESPTPQNPRIAESAYDPYADTYRDVNLQAFQSPLQTVQYGGKLPDLVERDAALALDGLGGDTFYGPQNQQEVQNAFDKYNSLRLVENGAFGDSFYGPQTQQEVSAAIDTANTRAGEFAVDGLGGDSFYGPQNQQEVQGAYDAYDQRLIQLAREAGLEQQRQDEFDATAQAQADLLAQNEQAQADFERYQQLQADQYRAAELSKELAQERFDRYDASRRLVEGGAFGTDFYGPQNQQEVQNVFDKYNSARLVESGAFGTDFYGPQTQQEVADTINQANTQLGNFAVDGLGGDSFYGPQNQQEVQNVLTASAQADLLERNARYEALTGNTGSQLTSAQADDFYNTVGLSSAQREFSLDDLSIEYPSNDPLRPAVFAGEISAQQADKLEADIKLYEKERDAVLANANRDFAFSDLPIDSGAASSRCLPGYVCPEGALATPQSPSDYRAGTDAVIAKMREDAERWRAREKFFSSNDALAEPVAKALVEGNERAAIVEKNLNSYLLAKSDLAASDASGINYGDARTDSLRAQNIGVYQANLERLTSGGEYTDLEKTVLRQARGDLTSEEFDKELRTQRYAGTLTGAIYNAGTSIFSPTVAQNASRIGLSDTEVNLQKAGDVGEAAFAVGERAVLIASVTPTGVAILGRVATAVVPERVAVVAGSALSRAEGAFTSSFDAFERGVFSRWANPGSVTEIGLGQGTADVAVAERLSAEFGGTAGGTNRTGGGLQTTEIEQRTQGTLDTVGGQTSAARQAGPQGTFLREALDSPPTVPERPISQQAAKVDVPPASYITADGRVGVNVFGRTSEPVAVEAGAATDVGADAAANRTLANNELPTTARPTAPATFPVKTAFDTELANFQKALRQDAAARADIAAERAAARLPQYEADVPQLWKTIDERIAQSRIPEIPTTPAPVVNRAISPIVDAVPPANVRVVEPISYPQYNPTLQTTGRLSESSLTPTNVNGATGPLATGKDVAIPIDTKLPTPVTNPAVLSTVQEKELESLLKQFAQQRKAPLEETLGDLSNVRPGLDRIPVEVEVGKTVGSLDPVIKSQSFSAASPIKNLDTISIKGLNREQALKLLGDAPPPPEGYAYMYRGLSQEYAQPKSSQFFSPDPDAALSYIGSPANNLDGTIVRMTVPKEYAIASDLNPYSMTSSYYRYPESWFNPNASADVIGSARWSRFAEEKTIAEWEATIPRFGEGSTDSFGVGSVPSNTLTDGGGFRPAGVGAETNSLSAAAKPIERVELPVVPPTGVQATVRVAGEAPTDGVEIYLSDRFGSAVTDSSATTQNAIRSAMDASGENLHVLVSRSEYDALKTALARGEIPPEISVYPIPNSALGTGTEVARLTPLGTAASEGATPFTGAGVNTSVPSVRGTVNPWGPVPANTAAEALAAGKGPWELAPKTSGVPSIPLAADTGSLSAAQRFSQWVIGPNSTAAGRATGAGVSLGTLFSGSVAIQQLSPVAPSSEVPAGGAPTGSGASPQSVDEAGFIASFQPNVPYAPDDLGDLNVSVPAPVSVPGSSPVDEKGFIDSFPPSTAPGTKTETKTDTKTVEKKTEAPPVKTPITPAPPRQEQQQSSGLGGVFRSIGNFASGFIGSFFSKPQQPTQQAQSTTPSTQTSPTTSAQTPAKPVVTLVANPASVTAGQEATLSWSSAQLSADGKCVVYDASNAQIRSGGSASEIASPLKVKPTATTKYKITCTSTAGSANGEVSVTVQ